MSQLLINKNDKKIQKHGGINQWNTLSDKEKLDADAEMMSNLVLQLGCQCYSQLSEDEKHRVDFCIWTGCAMHKDLNCVKWGNKEMMDWYEQNNVKGSILLPNHDNSAVLANADESEEPTAAEQRAQDISTCGGVKLASLAEALFWNKDSKVGQQDTYQHFFQSRGQSVTRFSDTNNARYQSHCAAAAELLIRRELYIDFLDWICDSKDKPGFTNIKNIHAGLTDVPTLTELAVLTREWHG